MWPLPSSRTWRVTDVADDLRAGIEALIPSRGEWLVSTRELRALLAAHPVQDDLAGAKAEAWEEGWEAGCNDQQYGNEDAEPWTPNPYRAALDSDVTP